MDAQPDQLNYDDLEVIGSTIVSESDDLPRRLSPIYRRRADPTCFLLPLPRDEEMDVPPPMSMEDRESMNTLVEDGDAVLFQDAIEAKSHHWLVQFESEAPPEYLPEREAYGRLRLVARQALERAAVALTRSDRSAALRESWYARRADPNDPLPLLVLIELLRTGFPPDEREVAIIQQDLAELHTSEAIQYARDRAQREAALSPLRGSVVSS